MKNKPNPTNGKSKQYLTWEEKLEQITHGSIIHYTEWGHQVRLISMDQIGARRFWECFKLNLVDFDKLRLGYMGVIRYDGKIFAIIKDWEDKTNSQQIKTHYRLIGKP